MPWSQITNPFNNLALSVLVALVPILFIFWALIIKKMEGYKAILLATLLAVLIAVFFTACRLNYLYSPSLLVRCMACSRFAG
jgi:L-lactate permease